MWASLGNPGRDQAEPTLFGPRNPFNRSETPAPTPDQIQPQPHSQKPKPRPRAPASKPPPAPAKPPARAAPRKETRLCYRCGGIGHLVLDCPSDPSTTRKRKAPPPTTRPQPQPAQAHGEEIRAATPSPSHEPRLGPQSPISTTPLCHRPQPSNPLRYGQQCFLWIQHHSLQPPRCQALGVISTHHPYHLHPHMPRHLGRPLGMDSVGREWRDILCYILVQNSSCRLCL